MQERDLSISSTKKPFIDFYSYMFIGVFIAVMIGTPLILKVSEYFVFVELVTIVVFLILAVIRAFKKYESIIKKVLASAWAILFSLLVMLIADSFAKNIVYKMLDLN